MKNGQTRRKAGRLLMFYADSCESCNVMDPLIRNLERDYGVRIDRLEVWHNQENKKLLEKYAGLSIVPFFYNEATGKKISGNVDYQDLKNWALG